MSLNDLIVTVDDLCLEYLSNFSLFDEIKGKYPDLKLIAFTISNFKNEEDLQSSWMFKEWYDKHKEWVEIAVHSYDHENPPDGDRENEELWIEQAYNNLKSFLPEEYGYRSPGWQSTIKTIPTLKKLGFSFIAYETKLNYFNKKIIKHGVINSHLYDQRSIKRIYEILQNQVT